MSENLDLVRSIYVDWERGDFSHVEWAHSDIDFEAVGFDPMRTVSAGAMADRWRLWMSAWENYRAEAEDYRELDNDRVLVLMRHSGTGKASGVGIESFKRDGATLFHIREGQITKLVAYLDREQAFADLGLKE